MSGRLDSNQRPPAPHADALPGCATSRKIILGSKYKPVCFKKIWITRYQYYFCLCYSKSKIKYCGLREKFQRATWQQ